MDGGPFANTVAASRKDSGGSTLDLHFRNTQGREPQATLYLGTSKVVDIKFDESRDRVKILPQSSTKIFGDASVKFRNKHSAAADSWGDWQTTREAGDSWLTSGVGDDLIAFLSNAEDERASKFTGTENEGYLQAGITKRFHDLCTVINRESIVSFPSKNEKHDILKEVHRPIDTALESLWNTERWARSKKKFDGSHADLAPKKQSGFGNKLDALAIDNDGNLLAIEVKGGYVTTGIAWTPAQVAVYKRILDRWLENDRDVARQTLVDSLEQRRTLGLAGDQQVADARKLRVIPVIVIGEITSPRSALTADQGMTLVRSELRAADEALEELRVFQVTGEDLACRDVDREGGLVAGPV